ncbi:efflux RND transporter permease subunit [Candidatus Kuenenia stuttgartensis]|uniref:efflux RND transporter permease subunit n=1 Tax=Kuenenia stuttgartiensis TaxID=174633 RepID=UPI001B8B9854|nr:efflux RND transporter permease subunit [Candidatus Kuenenia stuttgartiensis]
MDSIRFSIEKPVTIIVGIIFVVLFGVISLLTMTYQLSPTITEPEITVTTTWVGATPYNIEREIIEEQEKVLKGIPGLVEMESESFDGMGSITLKFTIETRIDDALLRVSNKLNEVPEYPENVDKPIINPTGSAASPVIWIILHATEDNPRSIYSYRTYFEDEVRQYLDRVKGFADLAIHGGTDKEMHIIINPQKMAAYGVTITELVSLLKAENVNISSGIMGIERRDYRIRTIGEFNSAKEIENIIIKSDGQQRIVLSDLAKVSFGYEKLSNVMLHNGEEAIAIGVKPGIGRKRT